jgi:ComF family protein
MLSLTHVPDGPPRRGHAPDADGRRGRAGGLVAQAARRVVDPLLAVVFPARCPACARLVRLPRHGPLCESCWAALPRHAAPLCRCGAGGGRCPRCRRGLNPIPQGASLGPYDGVLRLLVHELKFRGKRSVAGRLAEALLDTAAVRAVLAEGCVLVPVPLHPRRLRARGYNQSELLARELSRRAGRRLVCGALVRRADTPPQTGLTAAARRANLRDAFVVRRKGPLAGRTIVLVDDVLTTGSTARACARALRQAGAGEVRLLTAARVL